MQQFRALFSKELGAYFKSSFAYLIFLIYLFVSIGGAFYFGGYLAMRDTSVYSLFYLQPAVLALLIPALTMRSWAEEYRSGTAEFLFTQPVADYLPVLAKFLAAAFFAVAMSCFLLPFIMLTANYLQIDWGNVLCSYVGLWLYVALFCALGCFVSALSKYTIISYLLTVFVSGLWLLFPQSGLYDTYNNFLFAEVGVSDVWYFVSFSVALWGLNVLLLSYRRSAQKYKMLRFGGLAGLFVFGVALLNVAMFMVFNNHKADFTSVRQYTLDANSKELVAKINTPLALDVYVAKDLKAKSAEYYYYYQQVKRFLEKYERESQGMIDVNITEVEPFSELEKIVLSSGLFYEENAKGTKDYFGAVLRDGNGQIEVIKQFLPQRRAYFERDIDKALLKLTNDEVLKTIGIYFDPRQELDKFNGFTLNLEDDYNVVNVTEDTYEISAKLDLLILVNPKNLPVYFMYAIDQYIANGGKVLIFVDLLTEGQSERTNFAPIAAVDFLDRMKLVVGGKLVDEGKAVELYNPLGQKLRIYKAMTFSAEGSDFVLEPVIESDNGYVAAIAKGRYQSVFTNNPHRNREVLQDMMPHTIFSVDDVEVALVGDADIIEDESWISDKSADSNPYSVVEKAGNMVVVRRLIDKMVGNVVYNNLPYKNGYENVMSIGEQINDDLYAKYDNEYKVINEELKNSRLQLLQKSGGDVEKLQTMLQVDAAGVQYAQIEQKMEGLFYKLRQEYSEKVNKIIMCSVFIWPVLATWLLWLMVFVLAKRKQRRIREAFNE